jgi:hypothetical protein
MGNARGRVLGWAVDLLDATIRSRALDLLLAEGVIALGPRRPAGRYRPTLSAAVDKLMIAVAALGGSRPNCPKGVN